MDLNKVIATFFGVGYIGKGAGTVAAMLVCVLLYFGVRLNLHTGCLLFYLTLIVFAAGTYSAGKVEKYWGKDNKRVVIDEVLGMLVSLLFLPINYTTLIAGLILFRFFDIRKPLGIRKLEQLKDGWGVMLDDLAAGVYANILLQIIVYLIANHYEAIF